MFFLILAIFNSFFKVLSKKNTRLKVAPAIPTGTPITLVKEIILIPLLAADKTIKALSK